jgi:hypothetical protein
MTPSASSAPLSGGRERGHRKNRQASSGQLQSAAEIAGVEHNAPRLKNRNFFIRRIYHNPVDKPFTLFIANGWESAKPCRLNFIPPTFPHLSASSSIHSMYGSAED